jgi:hypothetical protein
VFLYDYFLNDLFRGERVPRLKFSAPKRFGHDLHIINVLIDRRKILTHRNDGNVTPSRFEQMELPVWTESEELRRFVAGYLAMLPVRKDPSAIDQRFIKYLLALTDGVTGRIIDLLRRAAIDALTQKSKSVGIDHLLVAGANLPAIINQRAEYPI